MASIINASSTGGGGIVQTADASGVLELRTDNISAVTITGGQTTGVASTKELMYVNGAIQAKSGTPALSNTNHVGYVFTSEIDSGMFSLGSGTITFATNGAERVRINSDGSFMVGTGGTWAGSDGYVYSRTTTRAWANFNGVTTTNITPRANFNVTSITYNAVGDYTINFTNAMQDANYAVAICGSDGLSYNHGRIASGGAGNVPTLMSTTAVRITYGATTNANCYTMSVIVFGL